LLALPAGVLLLKGLPGGLELRECSRRQDKLFVPSVQTRFPLLAIEHNEQQVALAHEQGTRKIERGAHFMIGISRGLLGEHQHAIEHQEQALALARELGDRAKEGLGSFWIGTCYHALGEQQRAIEHHEQALLVALELGDREREVKAYLYLAF
jgi:tetratricopeptide (TPR) repeat protein